MLEILSLFVFLKMLKNSRSEESHFSFFVKCTFAGISWRPDVGQGLASLRRIIFLHLRVTQKQVPNILERDGVLHIRTLPPVKIVTNSAAEK